MNQEELKRGILGINICLCEFTLFIEDYEFERPNTPRSWSGGARSRLPPPSRSVSIIFPAYPSLNLPVGLLHKYDRVNTPLALLGFPFHSVRLEVYFQSMFLQGSGLINTRGAEMFISKDTIAKLIGYMQSQRNQIAVGCWM